MSELRRHFRPEFLNRVDDIVLFKPLTLEEVEKIIDLLTQDLARRLKDRRIKLEMSRRHADSSHRLGMIQCLAHGR